MPYIYKSGLQFGITETNIYGSSDYVELTQAEYDALSTAEKHNGQIYFITDSNYDYIVVNDSVPIGSIQAYGGLLTPNNWLICDGSAVSRSDYYELFQVLGTTYGAGDGSTTFNLPDLRGRSIIGSGQGTASDATNRVLGTTGGSERVTLTATQMPAHGHNVRGWVPAGTLGDARRWTSNGTVEEVATAGRYINSSAGGWSSTTFQVASNGAGDPIGYTEQSGGGQSHGNMPPYLTTNYIIKAKNPSLTSGQQLQMLEMCYPVGSYFETSDMDFDPNEVWGGVWECTPIKNIIKSSGEKTITAAETYTLCSATLEPNTKYIIFGNVATNNGSNFTIICNLNISGTVIYQLGDSARTTTNAGQGVVTWHYVETGDSSVTVDCLSYGYYTTSHIERGKILAIPLNQSGNYKWHRTA